MNLLVNGLAALIPMVVGAIYYNPKLLGNAWMKAAEMTEEKIKGANMAVILIVSVVLSFMLSIQMNFLVIHQAHLDSIVMGVTGFGQEGSEVMNDLAAFKQKYGGEFRTFKHGAFHGVLTGFFFVLPVLGTNALFERKGFKYIAINTLYWIITLALMGGVICQWS
jgi:hypothetical protein